MGRTKAVPMKLSPSHPAIIGTPYPKRSKKKNVIKTYTVVQPTERSKQYYLGEVSIGTSKNVLPDSWSKCRVTYPPLHVSNFLIHLTFDNDITVIVNVTNDVPFVKGLFSSSVFLMTFRIHEDNFLAQVYLSKFPLSNFNKTIGQTIKTLVAVTFDIEVESTEIEKISNITESKEITQLYKNIKTVRDILIPIPKICVQSPHLKPQLRPYQEDAVRWMVHQESESESKEIMHPLYKELHLSTGITVYFNKYDGYMELQKPMVLSSRTGGILADEMGLGKTVEVLACIFAHARPVSENNAQDAPSTSQNNCDELNVSPTILMQPKKRKREINSTSKTSTVSATTTDDELCDTDNTILKRPKRYRKQTSSNNTTNIDDSDDPDCPQTKKHGRNSFSSSTDSSDDSDYKSPRQTKKHRKSTLSTSSDDSNDPDYRSMKQTKKHRRSTILTSSSDSDDVHYKTPKQTGKQRSIVSDDTDDSDDDFDYKTARQTRRHTRSAASTSMDDHNYTTRQSKKRIRGRASTSKNTNSDYTDTSKKLNIPEDWVKRSSNKSETRIALEMWYDNMLLETTAKKSLNKSKKPRLQCICGKTDMKGAIRCVDCFRYQHPSCLGFQKKYGYRCPQCWIDQDYLESKATLIVCPLSLRNQWSEEIYKHIKGGLKVLVYEGSRVAPVYPTDLCKYDLVLTTYNVLQTELRLTDSGQSLSLRNERRYSVPGSSLSRIKWWRLCLDEAQAVEVPSCMISTMAKKLQAHYRWAITGTPITKSISDLFGLIDYLQLAPYSDSTIWRNLFYLPYLSGNTKPMLEFLAKVLWRTSKCDVLDQIDIPQQTVNEYKLEFSAVEKYYYKREHAMCSNDFLTKLKPFDDSLPLKCLHSSSLKNIMGPLRSIRNACTHPNATKGRYLATRKSVTSMEGLLEALIEKNISDSEENLRVVVSALNGLAGIYLLLENREEAVAKYREVLQLSSRFNSEDPKKGLCVDKLQLIHAMYNLADVLDLYPQVQPTLRDHTLRRDCLAVQQKYMEKYANQNLTAYEESMTAINAVIKLEEKCTLAHTEWYTRLFNWVILQDLRDDLRNRIITLLDNANLNMPWFQDERKLMYMVTRWNEELDDLRSTTIDMLNDMYEYSEDCKLTICEGLVQAAIDCHLRPQKKSKKQKTCLVCEISVQMRQYEAKLYDMTKSKGIDDISNKGSWKPASEEIVLKGLLQLGRAKNTDKELIINGELYFNILEAKKKEFKQLRKFWTYLDGQICALDEINICKTRLSLKQPGEEREKKNQMPNVDRILKQLTTVIENKLESINLLSEHELLYQESVLRGEENQNMATLERNLGTHSYLVTLRNQQYAGQDPDPCPICKNTLQDHWNILPCGHCYCLECIQLLLEKVHSYNIACSICRQTHKVDDISYIRTVSENIEEDGIKIKGSYSTKVESVVKLIMKLKHENSDVKVLIFSTWTGVLNILKGALEMNDVTAEFTDGTSKLPRSIRNFKDKTKNTTALLLPISLGSKGLNLIEATHVILLEPLLDPSDELQAIGRVHRIGQTRETTVHKFVVKNTIEENIQHATSLDSANWDKNKVTLKQLKNLFLETVDGEQMPMQPVPEIHISTETSYIDGYEYY